jgi:hypothetical protein
MKPVRVGMGGVGVENSERSKKLRLEVKAVGFPCRGGFENGDMQGPTQEHVKVKVVRQHTVRMCCKICKMKAYVRTQLMEDDLIRSEAGSRATYDRKVSNPVMK